jgi:hypothetical protein
MVKVFEGDVGCGGESFDEASGAKAKLEEFEVAEAESDFALRQTPQVRFAELEVVGSVGFDRTHVTGEGEAGDLQRVGGGVVVDMDEAGKWRVECQSASVARESGCMHERRGEIRFQGIGQQADVRKAVDQNGERKNALAGE